MQNKSLVYNPLKHDKTVVAPDPGTAKEFREMYLGRTWFRDPWTGELRNDEDIKNDPSGVKIIPPDELAEIIEAFKNAPPGKLQLMPSDTQYMTAQCQQDLYRLAKDLLDPERFGHAVSKEIRNQARRALGIAPLE